MIEVAAGRHRRRGRASACSPSSTSVASPRRRRAARQMSQRSRSGMDYVTAATFPVVYATSHLALCHRARLRPGEVLLVHGASGGVGLTAVEVGKAIGATVIASAEQRREARGRTRARRGHADQLRGGGHPRARARADDGGGADVVYDPVGGDAFTASLRVHPARRSHPRDRLRQRHRAADPGEPPAREGRLGARRSASGSCGGTGRMPSRRPWTSCVRWHAEGRLQPLVSRTLPLERAVERAARCSATGARPARSRSPSATCPPAGSPRVSRVAVIGAGAVGCYYGARLAQAGHEVHFLMRRDYDAVAAGGLRVDEQGRRLRARPAPAVARRSGGDRTGRLGAVRAQGDGDRGGARRSSRRASAPDTRILAADERARRSRSASRSGSARRASSAGSPSPASTAASRARCTTSTTAR